MMKTISNALWRFRHALNSYYVHRGLSPLNLFGYMTPNEWDTVVQQHTTPQDVALNNKMKELNVKNKFRHKLGPGGYKAAMPKWANKEQELCDGRILLPLEGCTMRTRNWIRDHSRIDDSGRLITSSFEVTSVVEKAKTLAAKEKTGEFKS
jgi:homospermidine synthase